ncbi:MAG: hypothetical protein GY793_01295 [Proteobacteria bacterium]|nr:hypothetical protein [Pseudomonadota bacterium]
MKKFLGLIALLMIQITPTHATTDMVIASVNNKAITLQNLQNRIELTNSIIKRKLSPLEFNILKKQALEQLVEEELKKQYSQASGVKITPKELQNTIKLVEKRRKLKSGELMKSIPEKLKATAMAQLKDNIYEQKIVQKVILPRVSVPNSEVSRLLSNTISNAQSKEVNISQISIKYEKGSKRVIAKIYQKLLQGEDFDKLTAVLSQGPKTSLGWFALEELNFNAKKELKSLKKGEFTKPFINQDTWYIVKVNDIKITKDIDISKTVEYKFMDFKKAKLDKKDFKQIKKESSKINGYSDFLVFVEKLKKQYSFEVENIDWKKETDLSKEQLSELTKTKPNNFNEIKLKDDGSIHFVYLLDKQVKDSKQIANIRQRILTNLKNKQAELKYRTFLDMLRKRSFIEIR